MMCWKCGGKTGLRDIDDRRYYCESCKAAALEEREINKGFYLYYKFLNMYERALGMLERKSLKFSTYAKTCEIIKTVGIKTPEAFESSDEILATIILLSAGYRVKTQVKIFNYRVDIYLEKQKTIVEIDGESHGSKRLYDSNRDKKIREALGMEWEIIRIPSTLLRKNPEMLIDAVRASRKEKVRVRKENGGIIPAYYSRQSRAAHENLFMQHTWSNA